MELQTISKIIIQAQEAFLIVKFLCEEETDPDTHYEKHMNAFFRYSRIVYWQLTVIELSKLFLSRQTERFNLITFLNKLRPGGLFQKFKISNEKIDGWQNRISAQTDDIENLKQQRDKVYVHTDSDNEGVANEVSLEKAENLLRIAKEVVKEINLTCFQTSYIFTPVGSPSENLKSCINNLTIAKKVKMEGYRRVAKKYGLEDELPDN